MLVTTVIENFLSIVFFGILQSYPKTKGMLFARAMLVTLFIRGLVVYRFEANFEIMDNAKLSSEKPSNFIKKFSLSKHKSKESIVT